ncbi:unnamed protein product [Alopecurus aequalis]
MERQLQQQDQAINMTAALEALAPLLNNPRRTVILAEASTSVVMVLLLLQLILGSYRRQTSSAWVQAGSWVTYNLSFPAIAYTLGLMQSSPVKNVMYPIWAISLLLAAGCTNAVKVYELDENKQWKRNIINFIQYVLYSSLICGLLLSGRTDFKIHLNDYHRNIFFQNISSPAVVFAFLPHVIAITAIYGRDCACLFVELGYIFTRMVSDFMENLPANDDGFDPVSMKGYRYPVHFICSTDQAITIDQIWQCEGRLLHSSGSSTDQGLKDVCLAYAMYELLKRRYYGMTCTEQHLDETRDFVLKGLLRGIDDDYERAFRIVEVELGFCHDYFFTKHAIIFALEPFFLGLFLVRISLILMVTYFVWVDTLSVKTLTAIIEVQSTRADNIVTILVLGIIMLIELLQAAFYMASDWCKVSVACRYVARSRYQGNDFFEKLMGCLSKLRIFGHWKNRIDQYSLLSKLTAADMADDNDLQAVKLAIARTLRLCHGLPTNGEGSLRRNGVFEEFSWALQGQPQTIIMLIWHIATEYVKTTSSASEEEVEFQRKVSVSLSRYCGYLLNSAPELLPGHFGDAWFVMRGLKQDARSQYGLQYREEDRSIFMTGIKLGRQLEAMEDSVQRWKVLADFWSERILYVAPSDNVKAHMERLASGGEFLTHIWVLLTHAGIHRINREEDRNTMPSQPSQASV